MRSTRPTDIARYCGPARLGPAVTLLLFRPDGFIARFK
jgi:hypothetical protein